MADYSIQALPIREEAQPLSIPTSRKLLCALTMIAILGSSLLCSMGVGKCVMGDRSQGISLTTLGSIVAVIALPILIFGFSEKRTKKIEIQNLDSFSEEVTCMLENNIFVISPSETSSGEFFPFASQHAEHLRRLIKEHGAVVFSGFKSLTPHQFSSAVEVVTEMPFEPYKGDTPRPAIGDNPHIYPSTVVAPGHKLPLHQEVSVGDRRNMPIYFSFFCIVPPETDTGETLLGSVQAVTQDVAREMPELWEHMKAHNVTYTMRYLPDHSWHTKWIQWWNPSHASISRRFGTVDKEEISQQCAREGLTCVWDSDGWLTIQRRGVPAVIEVDNEILLCNQMYLDRFNPRLCGENFFVRWISYIFARLILYQTENSTQFDAWFDDGRKLSLKEAGQIISITNRHEKSRSWKRGDLMIVYNATEMHGKLPHSDRGKRNEEKRRIIVGLSGHVAN